MQPLHIISSSTPSSTVTWSRGNTVSHCKHWASSCSRSPAYHRTWGRGGPGALPAGEITIGVIGASEEDASLSCLAQDDLASILWAGHTDFFQQRFGVTAGREIRAADELAVPPPTDDQVLPAFRAGSANLRSGSVLVTGISAWAFLPRRKGGIKLTYHLVPILFSSCHLVQLVSIVAVKFRSTISGKCSTTRSLTRIPVSVGVKRLASRTT